MASRPKVERGDLLRVVGLVSQYVQARPYEGGYRLLVRHDVDVTVGPGRLPVTGGEEAE
jgi:hypothetical protein